MEERIIPGYEQYKKYITKAQKAKLVEGQQRFNNQLADERVNAMGQMRSDINQQRAYLQNRGLAGNGAPFHSGAEAYGVQQNQAAFRGYNQQLQGVQDAQTEQLAAKFASDTRRARARAAAQKQFTEYLDKLTNADRDEMMNGTGDEAKAFQAQVKKALGKKGMDTLRGQTYTSRTSAENVMNYMGGLSQKELASLDTDPAMAGIRQEIIDSVGMENYELMKGYYAKPKQTSVSSMGQGLSFDAKSAISRLSSMGTTGNQGRMEQDIATRMNATLDAFNGNPALSMPVQQLGMVTVADRADRAAAIQPTYNLDAYRGEWLDTNYNYTQNEARIQELNGNLENAGKFVENAQRLVDHYTGLSKTRQLTMDEWEQMEQASYYVKNSSRIAEEWGKEIAALERKQAKAEEAWGDVRTFFTDTMPRYGQYDLGDMEEIIAQRKAAGDTAGADEASRVLAQKLQDYTADWTREARDGGNTTAGHAYHGEPEDYTFENNTGSHYYNVVNDNKVLLWWNEQANRALLKQTQDAVSTIGGMSDGAVLFETLFGSIKGVAQGKGAAAGIAEMTDTAWTEEEFKAWQHMNDQDVFLAEYAEGMTKEQVDTFNYVYNAYGPAEADRYFESIFAQLDARVADNVSESAREIVEGHAILGTLVATPLKFTLSAVSPLTSARASMLTPEGYGGSKGQAAKNNYASLITSGVMQNMHMNAEQRFYYGVATSMLDSWFAAGLSGNAFGGGPGANVGGTMLGMSAFNSSYQEAVNRGLAPAQAYTTAVVAGAIEMLTEKYSIEALLNTHEAKLFSPEFFANIAKQSISEGSEETASSICNNIADVIINGDKAELVQQYHQLVDSGDYDEKGALGKVIWDAVKETGMETLAGMMSGALSGGSATVMQNFSTWMHGGKTTAQYAREGEAIRTDAEQMKKLAAHEFTSEIGQDLMESAESVEKASDAELARLNEVMQMEEAASEAVSGVKAQDGAMEALRAYEYRSPEAQVVAQKENYSDSDIAYLAQERLNQEMQDAAQALSSNQEAMKTYPVFTKIANGQAITMEEARQIADNDAAMAFFAQKYGAANGADGVLQNATMASRKVQQTYGTLKDAQVSGTTARKAEKIFRDASTIAEDTKTQDFKTRRGSVQVALRSGDTRYFSSQQKAAIGLCIAAANATGANIVVRDTFRTSDKQRLKDTPRGFYDRDTNTIEIALDSDQSVAYVLGHELVHYMEHYAGEGYAAFRDIVFDALDKVDVSKLDADLQRTIQAAREQNPEMSISEAMVAYENKRQGGNLSKPKAEGEVLAEAGSAMLLQKSVQKEIARLNNVTVAERIVEFAHKMGEEIKKLLGEKDFTGEEYNMLKGQADTMRKMEAAYRAMLMEANLNAKKQMEKEAAKTETKQEPKKEPKKKLNGANDAVLKVARSITENYKGFNLNKLSGQIAAAYRMAVDGDADSAMAEVRKIAADIAHTAKMEKESVNQEQYGALKSALEDFRHAYVEEEDRADSAYKTGSIRAFNNAMRAAGINFSLVTNANIDAPKLEDVYRQMTEQGMYGDVHQFGDMLPRDINVKDMAQTLLEAAQRMKPDHTLVPAYEALGTTEEELADSIADDLAQGFADVQFSLRGDQISAIQALPAISAAALDEKELDVLKDMQQYWEKLEKRSPYYRAVNGEWRFHDDTPITVATKQDAARGLQKNNDTGWDINVSGKVFAEAVHNNAATRKARPYLPYINDIVRNAVLVDTVPMGGRAKSINSLVMHEMYAIADNGNGNEVLKLVVEEMYDPASESTNKRTYKLTNIEKQPTSVGGSQNNSANLITLPTAIHTVSDLFKYVNDYKYLENLNKRNRTADDDRYIRHLVDQAAEEAMKNSKVRDENGKLLVVYHGTDKDFTVFDPKKTRNTGDVQGMFFSPYEVDAGGYGDAKAFYLNIVRPAKDTAAYALMNSAKSKGLDNPGEYARTMLQRRGNDGVFNGYDEYIAFHPEQIKSADLVTRDDNGNIIPLSQRFNQENPDVRYSVRDEKNGEPYRNDAVADGGTFVQEYTDNAPEVHVPETWVSEYTDNKPTVYHDETRVYFSDGDGTRAAMEQNVEKNMREVTEEIIEPFAELKREDWHGIIAQTRNANFLKQMPVERVLDAICGKNAELRQKMYELVEKPFNEAGGKFARSREAMFQKYTKAMDDLGIKTREQSAAIQRIGEHSYQHKCTVQAWETGNSQYHVRVVDPEQMDVKKQTVTDGQRTFAIEDGRIPIAFRVSDGEGNMVDVAFTLHTENGKQTITLHHNVHGETELFTAGQEGVKEYDMTFRDVMASFQGYGKTIASKAAKYGMAKNSPHVMTDSAYAPYTLEMLQNDHPDDWQNIVEAEKVSRRMYDEYVDSINHMLETVYPMVYEKDEQTIEQLQAKVDEAREDSANQRELITRIKAAIEQGQATIAMMDNTTQEYADAQHSLAVVEQRLKDATKKLAKLTKKAELREAKLTEYQAMVASGDTLRNKRLQKRSDYYHHFQELTDNVVVNLRNILKTNTDIDPQLVNISDQTKPKSKWTEFLQQRVGGAYTEDAVNGMYKYIAGAEYILAYDPLISRFREIQKQYDKATREMKGSSESVLNSKNANNFMRWMNAWVNNIAGKTHDIDRVISNEMGDRRGLKFIQKLNGLGKSAKLLFNVRSALVQVSNMTNAAMYVDAVDWKNGWFNCLNAMKGKEMAEILAKSNFVSQRLAEVPVFEEATLKTKAMNFANWMLSAGDSFSTQMTWWAAYNQYERIGAEAADAKGYRHYEDAIDYADDITRRTHGGRGVGELPVTLQSRLVNLFAPFQVEVLNTFENLVQVIGKKDALGIAKMQCSIFAFNMVTRCIFGDGVLGFDFIHALMSILKDVFFPEDKEEKLQDHLKFAGQQLLGELISGVPFAAQAATFLVPDETARENMFGDSDPTRYGTGTIGLSFIAEMVNIFNDLVNGKDVTWDLLDATVGNYMTGGSQIMRTAKGLYTWVSGYSTDKKGNVQFAIDQDATELVLMAIFGKWSVPEAREYLGSLDPIADAGYKRTAPNGKKPGITSDNQNAGYKEFVKAGGNGKDFIKMVKQCSMAEGQKDANGKTISGSVKQAKLDIINGYGLSASLKNIVLQALNIKE